MKKFLKKFLNVLVILAFTSTVAMAYVTPGDLNRLRGLAMTLVSATITTLTSTTAAITTLTGTTSTYTTAVGTTVNAGASGTAGTLNVYPATAANGIFKLLAVNNSGAFNSTLSNTNIGQATVYSLPDAGSATTNLLVDKGNQSIAGVKSFTGTLEAGISGTAGTLNVYPGTAANGVLKLLAVNNTGAFNSTISNKNIGQSTVYSLPECSAATCDVLTTASAQTLTGVNTFGAASSIVSKTSTSSTDINPPYDNRILGNPVVKYVYGSCSVAAVNGGTCVPLALASSRTIAVLNYDIVAAGSAATCTGILLEDTTGTPVVVSTIAAAALTSGTHNFPGLANNVLGVGFGAGSGLTVSQGLQIKVNGSSCTTTTAFQYAITYTVQ